MKKRYIVSAVGAGAGAAGMFIRNRMKQKNETDVEEGLMEKDTILNNAGVPDQVDDADIAQLENAKMVSEGSMFGVSYYNERQDDQLS